MMGILEKIYICFNVVIVCVSYGLPTTSRVLR